MNKENTMDFRLTFSGRLRYKFGGGVSFHKHPHDYQIQLIYGGTASIMIDRKIYHAKQNDVFFIKQGSMHEFTVDSEEDLKTLELKFETNDNELLSLLSNIRPCLHDCNGQLFGLFSNIVIEGYQKSFAYKELSNAMLLSILSIMARLSVTNSHHSDFSGNSSEVSKSTLLQDVTEFILNNINKKYTLPELAKYCGYNKDFLYRTIKKETGLSAIQYINKLKFEQARKLIQHTELTLSEIAWNLGFSSLQYFSRFFKEHANISPSEFMEEVRNTMQTDY